MGKYIKNEQLPSKELVEAIRVNEDLLTEAVNNYKPLSESVSVYNKEYGQFHIDDGMLKLFTFNKEVCDLIDVSHYNLATFRKFYIIQWKIRRPLYHNNINYSQMVFDTLKYARLRNLANKILAKVALYNMEQQTVAIESDIFVAQNRVFKPKPKGAGDDNYDKYWDLANIVGKLKITSKKVTLWWEDIGSDDSENIFTFDNGLNLYMEIITLVQTKLMDVSWNHLPSNITGRG